MWKFGTSVPFWRLYIPQVVSLPKPDSWICVFLSYIDIRFLDIVWTLKHWVTGCDMWTLISDCHRLSYISMINYNDEDSIGGIPTSRGHVAALKPKPHLPVACYPRPLVEACYPSALVKPWHAAGAPVAAHMVQGQKRLSVLRGAVQTRAGISWGWGWTAVRCRRTKPVRHAPRLQRTQGWCGLSDVDMRSAGEKCMHSVRECVVQMHIFHILRSIRWGKGERPRNRIEVFKPRPSRVHPCLERREGETWFFRAQDVVSPSTFSGVGVENDGAWLAVVVIVLIEADRVVVVDLDVDVEAEEGVAWVIWWTCWTWTVLSWSLFTVGTEEPD